MANLQTDTQVLKASAFPIVFAILAVVISTALYFLAKPLSTNLVYLFGYLLTPLATFGFVAWDSVSQKLKSKSVWFDKAPKKSLAVRVIAGLSFIPGTLHIIQLGTILGETAIQEGWFS